MNVVPSNDIETIVRQLDAALRAAGEPERAINEKSYLKSPIEHYGVRVPAIRSTVKSTLGAQGGLTIPRLRALVRRLWSSSVHEQRMAAVILLEQNAESLGAGDLPLVYEMIRDAFTWAYVDGLAARVAGSIIERHPTQAGELDRWAQDDSFWVRRAAMLALMGPLRAGRGDWARFAGYADAMLEEKEFFIRKAIGWVLRETSKKRPQLVRQYVASRLDRMSGLTFREAVKRLPEKDRAELDRARAGGGSR
ncbi:MAG: DNA alkylation repair protein [Gemmatimonadota bacterium]|nr:DNA alkylation repair protein [Gemmatimonadota bacterium]